MSSIIGESVISKENKNIYENMFKLLQPVDSAMSQCGYINNKRFMYFIKQLNTKMNVRRKSNNGYWYSFSIGNKEDQYVYIKKYDTFHFHETIEKCIYNKYQLWEYGKRNGVFN